MGSFGPKYPAQDFWALATGPLGNGSSSRSNSQNKLLLMLNRYLYRFCLSLVYFLEYGICILNDFCIGFNVLFLAAKELSDSRKREIVAASAGTRSEAP